MNVRFDPVFIIAYSRSGTEMLSHMLNGHPMISISPEGPRSWEVLYSKIGGQYYTPEKINYLVNTMVNFDGRFSDAQDRVRLHNILAKNLPAPIEVVIACFFQAWGEKFDKINSRWGDKCTSNYQFLSHLSKWYPNAQYIHLVRDPRDVVSSIIKNYHKHFSKGSMGMKLRMFPSSHINLSWRWRNAHRIISRYGQNFGEKKIFFIKYEDLVGDSERCLRNICKFLGIEFNENMLQFYKKVRRAGLKGPQKVTHSELSKPAHNRRIGRHKENLSREMIQDVEYICRNEMNDLGYGYESSRISPGKSYAIKTTSIIFDMIWAFNKVYRKSRGRLA